MLNKKFRCGLTDAYGEGDDPYTIEKVGTVQITKIVNDHFATVKLISGDIAAKDMVELED